MHQTVAKKNCPVGKYKRGPLCANTKMWPVIQYSKEYKLITSVYLGWNSQVLSVTELEIAWWSRTICRVFLREEEAFPPLEIFGLALDQFKCLATVTLVLCIIHVNNSLILL